jgi:hypothetical protein
VVFRWRDCAGIGTSVRYNPRGNLAGNSRPTGCAACAIGPTGSIPCAVRGCALAVDLDHCAHCVYINPPLEPRSLPVKHHHSHSQASSRAVFKSASERRDGGIRAGRVQITQAGWLAGYRGVASGCWLARAEGGEISWNPHPRSRSASFRKAQGAQGVRLWADTVVRHYYDTIFVIKKKRTEQNRAREQGGSKLRVFTRPYRNGSHCCGGESSQSEIWYARGLLARACSPLDSLRQACTPVDPLQQACTPVDPLFGVVRIWTKSGT